MRYLIISIVFFALRAVASEPEVAGEPVKVSLEQVLKGALSNNGQMGEALGEIEVARQQLARARAAMLPKAEGLLLAAPIFEERGNALQSTQNWKKWGPYLQGGVQIVQPLYTFGQISNYEEAALNQILAREGQADMKRAEIVGTAKEMFYGYLMACDLDRLVEDLVSFLGEAVETAEKSLKKKRSTQVKPHDLYRLQTALEDLRQKGLHAKQAKKTAERAVAWVSGLTFEKISPKGLAAQPFSKKSLEEYLQMSKDHRPEFKALRSGLDARAALERAKRAQSYPVIFAGGFVSHAWSPVREKQQSIFANDPFNRTAGGIGLGVKFDLEFWRHSAEAGEERGEWLKLKAKEEYAVSGIDLQVKKAFWELEQAEEGLKVAENRKEIGKKWFVSNAMGWSIGITPAKDLLESLEGDGLARKNYIETLYAYNMALANLTRAVGQEVSELSY